MGLSAGSPAKWVNTADHLCVLAVTSRLLVFIDGAGHIFCAWLAAAACLLDPHRPPSPPSCSPSLVLTSMAGARLEHPSAMPQTCAPGGPRTPHTRTLCHAPHPSLYLCCSLPAHATQPGSPPWSWLHSTPHACHAACQTMQPAGSRCGRVSVQHVLATVWQPGASPHARIDAPPLVKVGNHVCRGMPWLGINKEKGGVGVGCWGGEGAGTALRGTMGYGGPLGEKVRSRERS